MLTFLLTNLSLVNHIFANQKKRKKYVHTHTHIYNANFILLQLLRNCDIGSCMHAVTSVMFDSLQPQWTIATRLLCPLDSPGKSIGVSCHALLQGNLPNPGTEIAFPAAPALQILWVSNAH